MVVNPKIHSEKCLTSKFHPKFGQNKLHYHKLGNHVMGDDISFGFRLLLFSFNQRTGCKSPNDTLFKLNILKKPLLVQKQTISQQKALDLSFNLAP